MVFFKMKMWLLPSILSLRSQVSKEKVTSGCQNASVGYVLLIALKVQGE